MMTEQNHQISQISIAMITENKKKIFLILKKHIGVRIANEILMYFRSNRKNGAVVSINEPIETDSEGNPLTLMDIVFTEDTIADDIDTVIKSEKLYKFVEEIDDEREKEIIINRYGLYEREPKTQKEIAADLGISRSYVSRIEKKVLEKLRKRFD